MRRSVALLLFTLLPSFAAAKTGPNFYICAHPDDCFLFMNPNLYDDITSAEKVVVVYLTSGDAGVPFSDDASAVPYPYVRELASIDATEWMADVGKDPIRAEETTDNVTLNGHDIERFSYANTVSYFLRLPDGNFYGKGFAHYNDESLRKLQTGEITSLTPIDGKKAYAGWWDVVGVLSGIVSSEMREEKNATLHIQDPDIEANYNNHSDHTAGANAMMEALTQSARDGGHCYQIYKHIDYAIADKEPNLSGAGLQNKAGSFAVLTATQRHSLEAHHWDGAHLPYLTRNYYRTSTLPEGCSNPE